VVASPLGRIVGGLGHQESLQKRGSPVFIKRIANCRGGGGRGLKKSTSSVGKRRSSRDSTDIPKKKEREVGAKPTGGD